MFLVMNINIYDRFTAGQAELSVAIPTLLMGSLFPSLLQLDAVLGVCRMVAVALIELQPTNMVILPLVHKLCNISLILVLS